MMPSCPPCSHAKMIRARIASAFAVVF